jgi:hypothetical protein
MNNGTCAVGVRIPRILLDRAKSIDPDFNLSQFVRCALLKEYGFVEERVDEVFILKGVD